VSREQDVVPRVWAWLRRTLGQILPQTRDVEITHRWAGPLGIARDWWPSVGLDRTSGLAWAGGYVGDGVGASNLAGRTLADLILARDTDRTTLPWVNHRSPTWEPEPLRWLGVNAGLTAMGYADPEEARTGRESLVARAFGRLMHG
jgi:glycine/D-amino acid oxidase-like deaminating enzyme